MPAARQAASVPPTVVAATAPLHDRGGEVARADLARRGVEAAELLLGRARHDLAVEHADGRRHRAAGADGALGGEPDLDALAGREAVRDERRLERDDAAPAGERRRAPPRRCGSRHRSELGAAARRRLEAELDAADEEAGGERVAGAGRVDDLGREGGVVHAGHVNAARRRA